MQAKVSQTYKPTVRLTAHRGWYKVQSGTTPSVFYDTTANSCTCPARKPCRHMKFIRSLNIAFYVRRDENPDAAMDAASEALHDADRAETAMPLAPAYRATLERMARGDTADTRTDTERRLDRALSALSDTHVMSDERASLLRRVDELERQVAADNASAMRVA